jgi:hypothetical protein
MRLYKIVVERKRIDGEDFIVTEIYDNYAKTSTRTDSKRAFLKFLNEQIFKHHFKIKRSKK